MSRARETWSCHDKRHPESPGSPFERGHPLRVSCIRCLQPRPLSALVTDQRVRGQKRCADGCAKGSAP